jgi:hypothetical protein
MTNKKERGIPKLCLDVFVRGAMAFSSFVSRADVVVVEIGVFLLL